MIHHGRLLAALALGLALPSVLPAQAPDSAAGASGSASQAEAVRGLATIGGTRDEQFRDAQLRGAEPMSGSLIRSTSSLTPWRERAGASVILPQAEFTWNSKIPYTVNDGAMWAGRGASGVVMAGVEIQAGALRLIVAPELEWTENRDFEDLLPKQWSAEQRASFIPPWQQREHSIDLPYRFGEDGWSRVRPGQSSLTVRAGRFATGAATESQWWGPGVRNAIVMTNNGPGIPHLFIRTDRPLRTPLGAVEAKWMVGALESSRHSDSVSGGGRRSLSAASLVLHPAAVPNLAVGVARAVYAPEEELAGVLSHSGDVFTRWRGSANPSAARPYEQISSVFGRWGFPRDGAEIYVEWARYRVPRSLPDLLEAPEHTQGYILGAQWLRPVRAGEIRLQAEHINLEESATYRTRPIGSYYASAAIPEGYTHEGQVIGAAIGPGASGQWLSVDWLYGGGRVGAVVGRVRWSNDAYYDNPATNRIRFIGREVPQSTVHGHDVTVLGGLRSRIPVGRLQLDADWAVGKRFNYLFQNYAVVWQNRESAVDVLNHTFRLGVSARVGKR